MQNLAPRPRPLDGQVAIIAGGSGGIGRAVTQRLADEGAAIALIDIDREQLNALVAELRERGATAISAVADISDRAAVRTAVESIRAEAGAPDILVNLVGVAPIAPFLEVSDAEWDAALRVNLTGGFVLGQEVAKLMAETGGGRIVYLSSLSAQVAHGNQAAYAASKAGIEALVRAMAVDLGPYGIRVNAVAPGAVMTEMNRAALSDSDRAKRLERIPLGRFGEPEDIAGIVAFLVSDDAAILTGLGLAADAGFLITGIRPVSA
ncbi:SDR family NAD(P)-dependent oxidoreductase [Microtetraspora sp. NBRC 16547]|uniref:SDR family NAD(P)-dependent oxidoreductase n=1 Tax=Microtetraspora sp. NBRC 16547 TaxID=3030993 RepID=UPI0024A2E994|nr:SDR family NAD(P)-dependent oxidoreductase [Microtetraspora sp. NBRC 16547]GLW98289.1 3-oxoacyl-ACP reductase [Microtetraspora sp. NBRC 16547]